jgi:hypothetical protein
MLNFPRPLLVLAPILLPALIAGVLSGACAKDPPEKDALGGVGGSSGSAGAAPCWNTDADAGAGGAGAEAPATLPWLHVDGNKIKDPAGNNVVLRGVAFPDLGFLQGWEGGINAMIDRVSAASDSQGCSPNWQTRVIRLAVAPADGSKTPAQYQPGGNYYDTILRPTVDYARQKGLYVIIDWHYIDDTTKHQATTTAFWTDIAPRFAADSNVLFELYNEPINGGNWTTVKADMQKWADIVRAAAPNNLVLVGTPNWCQYVGTAAASPITGANIVYVAHMYPQHWAQSSLRTQIASAVALAPVLVTEWGFQRGVTTNGTVNAILDGTITSYGNPFKQFIEQQGIGWTAWCASKSWQPTMFAADFKLLGGEGEMGAFTKDWLYEKRVDNQPTP